MRIVFLLAFAVRIKLIQYGDTERLQTSVKRAFRFSVQMARRAEGATDRTRPILETVYVFGFDYYCIFELFSSTRALVLIQVDQSK